MLKTSVLVPALFLLMASTAVAQTNNFYWSGPYVSEGMGISEEIARDHARDGVEEYLEELENDLPPGHSVYGIEVFSETWDGFEYTINYRVMIQINGSGQPGSN